MQISFRTALALSLNLTAALAMAIYFTRCPLYVTVSNPLNDFPKLSLFSTIIDMNQVMYVFVIARIIHQAMKTL